MRNYRVRIEQMNPFFFEKMLNRLVLFIDRYVIVKENEICNAACSINHNHKELSILFVFYRPFSLLLKLRPAITFGAKCLHEKWKTQTTNEINLL